MRNRVRISHRASIDELYARTRSTAGEVVGGADPFISAKQFGVVGNGVANDTANMQTALNALSGTGISLWLPAGTYNIAGVLTIPAATNIWRAAGVSFTGAGSLALAVQSFVDGASPGAPAYNPSWSALTDVFWDPANASGLASDANDGSTALTPVLTWAEIVRRYGSDSPRFPYGQTVTFHLMSAQPAGVDPVFFFPRVSGGGQAILDGLLGMVAAGPSFGAGTLGGGFGSAGAAASSGGTQMTMATAPAYVIQGVLLENTARGSYAFVDSVSGGTASLTQPMTKASLTTFSGAVPTVDNDWVAGDTINAWTLPSANLKAWNPYGADTTAAPVQSGGVVVRVSVAETSGTGASPFSSAAPTLALFSCVLFNGFFDPGASGGGGVILMNTLHVHNTLWSAGLLTAYGGALRGVTFLDGNMAVNAANFRLNACLHGSVFVSGVTVLNGVFSDGTITLEENAAVRVTGAASSFWGSFNVTLQPMSCFENATSSTFAASALLTSGTIKIGTATTGFTGPASGTFTLNGVNQVTVTGAGVNQFPSTAAIAWSLNQVGTTAGVGSPYFSQAQSANNFFVKSPTAGANDIYNWTAQPVGGISLTQANLDTYNGLQNPRSGARYTNGT